MVKRYINYSKRTIVIVAVLAVLGLVNVLYTHSWSSMPFDSKNWQAARSIGDNKTCYRMSASLLGELQASRPAISDVEAMLGPADFRPTHVVYTYRIGRGPYLPVTRLVTIVTGPGDRVERAFLTSD